MHGLWRDCAHWIRVMEVFTFVLIPLNGQCFCQNDVYQPVFTGRSALQYTPHCSPECLIAELNDSVSR